MLVSATIRGTLLAAAKLLDGLLDVGLGHSEFPGPTSTVALEAAPTALLAISAQRLAEDLSLRTAFLLRKPLRLADYVRRERERADSRGRHLCDPQLRASIAHALPQVKG